MKIIDTDNFGRDYPDEKVIAENVQQPYADRMCAALNQGGGDRYYRVVEDDYILQPGLTP